MAPCAATERNGRSLTEIWYVAAVTTPISESFDLARLEQLQDEGAFLKNSENTLLIHQHTGTVGPRQRPLEGPAAAPTNQLPR